MNLLECIQRHLGSIEAWPTDISFYLFCCPLSDSRIRAVAAFFYGSDVRLMIASAFFHTRNYALSPFDIEKLNDSYSYWQTSMYKHRMRQHYNMTLGKYMYINGKCVDQLDVMQPQPFWLDFGIAATGWAVYSLQDTPHHAGRETSYRLITMSATCWLIHISHHTLFHFSWPLTPPQVNTMSRVSAMIHT